MDTEELKELIRFDDSGNIFVDGVNITPALTNILSAGKLEHVDSPYASHDGAAGMRELKSLIFKLEYSAALAEVFKSNLSEEFLNMDGMSTEKVRHYLNNACSSVEFSSGTKNYLEVGCASGSTYISSNFKSNLDRSYVCDIFTEEKCGANGKDDFINNCQKYLGHPPKNLINEDCFSLDLSSFTEKINLYLFDGPHEVNDHRKALTYFEEIFDDTVVVFIDDWNDDRVQLGTLLGLSEIEYDVAFWRYDPANLQIAPFGVVPAIRKPIKLSGIGATRGYSLDFGDQHRWTNGFMTMILRKRK